MARIADPNLKTDILRAAREAFTSLGYSKTRMVDIAERAGIAPGTIYLYFKSKDDLAVALAQEVIRQIYAASLPHLAGTDAATGIARAVHAALEESRKEHDILHVLHLNAGLFAQAQVKPLEARRERHSRRAAVLEAQMDAGQIRHSNPQILAELVSGLVEWTAEACLVWGDGDLDVYERELVQLLQRALVLSPGLPEASRTKAG